MLSDHVLSHSQYLIRITYSAICYVKASKRPWYNAYNLAAMIYYGILVVVGYVSVVITIMNVIKGKT